MIILFAITLFLGVKWLYNSFLRQSGCILGDDMGLGKTLQIIAFLQGAWQAAMIDNAILIVPTSLLENWNREFKKWCGNVMKKKIIIIIIII